MRRANVAALTERSEERLRVVMVAHLSEISGAGTALLEIARGLDRERFEIIMVLPGDGPLTERARAAGVNTLIVANRERSLQSLRWRGRALLAFSRLRYMHRLYRTLKQLTPDVVYINSTATIFAGVAAAAAHLPIVWHVHETLTDSGWATKVKMAVISRAADALVYASSSAEAAFPARRVALRLIARNRIAAQEIAESSPMMTSSELAKYGIALGSRLLVSSGLIRRKGPDVLIRAFSLLPADLRQSAVLAILGEAPAESAAFAAELRKMPAQLGISAQVHFPGLQPSIIPWLRTADGFISSSRNEALPIAIVEAMAAGTPVVATEVGDCARLLAEGSFGLLIPPDDPGKLANALRELLLHPDLARSRAAAAQQAIAEEYDGNDFWKPLEQLIVETSSASHLTR